MHAKVSLYEHQEAEKEEAAAAADKASKKQLQKQKNCLEKTPEKKPNWKTYHIKQHWVAKVEVEAAAELSTQWMNTQLN